MTRIAIVGCGIVGATIAYELSRHSQLDIHLIEQQNPAQGSTQAALGVLMGIISHKVKGRNWRLRRDSIERYKTLLPELEAALGRQIPHVQGLLSLCFDSDQLPRWQSLQAKRADQGYALEIWSPEQLRQQCPQINAHTVTAAIFSPEDGQVHPHQLTLALVEAAKQRGVTTHWQSPVLGLKTQPCTQLQLPETTLDADFVVISAGLDSADLSQIGTEPLPMIPVLGQALELELDQPLGHDNFQPVINGHDVHIVPLGENRYWLGATVEFPPGGEAVELPLAEDLELAPEAERLEHMRQIATDYCPALIKARIVRHWSGLRPRPQGQGAPVIKPLAGLENVILATGHYRNGVLLAPATAMTVEALLGLLD
ncbi:MAG: FAD-dependent oxidoreductase [Cyanobacteria bacterium P01_D01_bin.156]